MRQWGEVFVSAGDADGNRLMIDGGSAGGYTTLCALTFRDQFKAGASHYGVSDAEALAKETHKFESRYLDNLIVHILSAAISTSSARRYTSPTNCLARSSSSREWKTKLCREPG